MSSQENMDGGYFKKETAIVAALIMFVAGFLAGVIYSSFKTDSGGSGQSSSGEEQQEFSSEEAGEILALQQEVTTNPENVNAWTRLGNLYFDSEQFEQAITAYNKSLALKPDDPDVRTDLGVMYRRNGQPDLALAAFNKAIEIDPKHPTARFNKGVVLYYDINDRDGAISVWEELVAIHPDAMAPNNMPVKQLIEEVKKDPKK